MKLATVSLIASTGFLAINLFFSPVAEGSGCLAPPSGLVGWWPGEGNAHDVVGTNNGSLAGSGVTFAPGKVGLGFRLDGTNGYVVVPNSTVLEPTNVTLEAWVWLDPNANTGPATESIFFKQNTWSYYFEGYSLCKASIDNGNGTYTSRFQFVVSRNGDQVAINSLTVVQRGVWYHVAATYDGNRSTLYVNGVPEASTIAGFPLDYGTEPVYFGTTGTPAPYTSMYAGIIDEPSIYNRALSASEITGLYNAGSAGKCPSETCVEAPSGLVGWWKGDGSAADEVAGNNGNLVNVNYTNGVVGQAFSFDPENLPYGTYTGVQIPDQPAYALTNSLTIEGWVRPRGDSYMIFFRGDHRPGFDPYFLSMQDNHTLDFYITQADGTTASVGTTLNYNEWTHVAATLDGGTGTMSLYTNGVLAGQLTTTVRPFAILQADQSPGIGIGNVNDGGNNFPFIGDVDEISLYNRALTSNEIAGLYNAGSAGKCPAPPPATPEIPEILEITPATATNGASVTISGANFSANASEDIVRFGAVQATVLAASSNSLTVATPVGATFGPVTVTVDGLTAYSGQMFEPTFIGNGSNLTTGSFAPSFDLSTGSGDTPGSAVIADLDGDGKPDIALVTSGHVSIFQNISTNGALLSATSFAPRVDLPFPSGTGANAYRLRAVDLDGDGKLDLIACEVYGSNVTVFHNIATPGTITTNSFEPAFDLPAGNDCRFATAADLDGDGRVDLVALNYGGNTISVFKNIGTVGSLNTNSFAPPVTLPAPGGPYEVTIADLDGDGKPDLAVACSDSGTVAIYQNITSPGVIDTNSFAPAFNLPCGNTSDTIEAVDLDGDGKLDLVAGSAQSDTISVFQNISSGGVLNTNSFAARVDFSTGDWTHTVAIADFNGDGKPDVGVVGELPSTMSIFQNLSTPGNFTSASFAPRLDFSTGWNAWGIAAGDLDGDGRPDIVFCNDYDSTLQIYQNVTPFGTPSVAPAITTPPANQTVIFGRDASFTVAASGTAPLSYQWFFNGTKIPGATNSTLYLPAVQSEQAGNYQVAVSNTAGGVISGNASLTVGTLVAWGRNDFGETNVPAGLNHVMLIAAGAYGSWALSADGTSAGWGGSPTPPTGSSNLVVVHPSYNFGLGLQADQTPLLWGGGSSYGETAMPADVTHCVSVAAGAFHGLAAKTDGTVVAWGLNIYGQTNVPAGLSNVIAVAAGDYHSLALKSDGTVTGWGWNGYGQTNVPGGLNNVVAIAAGYWQSVALKADGTVVTWGGGSPIPSGLSNVVAIVCGDEYNLALLRDGTLAAWGDNTYGQTTIPAGITNVLQIAAGNAHNVILLGKPAPQIMRQPQSVAVSNNNPVVFYAPALGRQPLAYQWRLNGLPVPGATASSLMLPSVQTADAGLYSVVVTNQFGSVTSSNALLTVTVTSSPPAIVSQTPSEVVLAGSSAAFSVTASGSDPLSYFWSRNGVLIPNATSSTYTLEDAQLTDSGSKFSCLVSNVYGTAASTNVFLKVLDTVSNDLCSGAVNITSFNYTNAQSTLDASSYGDPVPDCIDGFGNGVWYQFTAPVNGLLYVDTFGSDFDTGLAAYTGSCDSLAELACNDDTGGVTSQVIVPATAGTTYYFLAGGYGGHAGNLIFHLNFLTPPAFISQPTNLFVTVSSNAVFNPTLSGSQPMSFQWFFNNSPLVDGGRISGAMNSTLIVSNVQPLDGGNYQLVASNIAGVTTSSVAVLTPVILPPVFIQPPADLSVPTGSNANFFAVVGGTPPYSYQWYFNGNPLTDDGVHVSGSTTGSLNISNVTTADAGSYSLTVTNVSGSANAAATLTVQVPPAFTLQPVGRSVPPGLPTVFTAAVSGTPTPSYQWQFNGTNIPGATSASYTNAAVSANDLGFYRLIASNWLGVAVSANAQLTFGPVAAWGRNTSGECLPPPGLSNVTAIAGNLTSSFAVRADGSLAAWGSGADTNIPASASNVVALATYQNFGECALRSDGSVVGWNGPIPPPLTNIVAIAEGNNFGYALRAEGTLTNWGAPLFPGFPPNLNHVTAIACGLNSAVALRSDGTIAAAGLATNYPPNLSNVVAVAAGNNYALALKGDGTVVAWGGKGPSLPSGLTNVVAISAGNSPLENLSLALRGDGSMVAWGDNPYGETNPPAALSNLLSAAIAAAPYHGLALVNDGSPQIMHPPVGLTAYTGRDVTLQGSAAGAAPLSYQWRLNGTNLPGATNPSLVISNVQMINAGKYQLLVSNNIGTAVSLPAPLNVISNITLTFLSQPGGFQTNYQGSTVTVGNVTVLGSGPLTYQWYFATNGGLRIPQLNTVVPGATNDTLVFNPALAGQSGYYYCVVSNRYNYAASFAVYQRVLFAKAWGFLPTDPPFNLTNAAAIAVGNYGIGTPYGDYYALSSAGKILGWSGGPVAYGETNFAALSNSIVTAIAAGNADVLALKSDGTVFAAGDGYYGETNVPATATGITAIACGDYHDLALKSDGTVIGWGQNYALETTNGAATNVVAIAAGGQSSMALRSDGTLVTWGIEGGQVPYPYSNAVAIACGNGFFVALRTNGTVVAWGNNASGQTTIPNNWTNIVAISAGANHTTALRNDGTVVSAGRISGYTPYASNSIPSDLANVVAIASSGDHDLALFGTRAPAFTVQPWSRTIPNTTTSAWFSAKCVGVQPVRYQWQFNGTNVPNATNDTLNVFATFTNQFQRLTPMPLHSGVYQLIASNAYGVVGSKYALLNVVVPLGSALNATNQPWTTSGNSPWFGETNITHDGVAAAQSGDIGPLQESDLFTTVATNVPGSYTFWWKVSSELGFDVLEFRINGVVQTSISGEVDWQQVSIHVPAGTNQLEWRYFKDASIASGLDAGWVDQFAYDTSPVILTQPVSVTNYLGTTATFNVTASGYPSPAYQWWWNRTNRVGGNSPWLVLNNVARAQEGTYSVTVINSSGTVVSSDATLRVLVPQLLGMPRLLPDGSLQLTSGDLNGGQITGADLARFEAQVSTNLVNWTTLSNSLSLSNGTLQLQDHGGTNSPARFYRIIEHQ